VATATAAQRLRIVRERPTRVVWLAAAARDSCRSLVWMPATCRWTVCGWPDVGKPDQRVDRQTSSQRRRPHWGGGGDERREAAEPAVQRSPRGGVALGHELGCRCGADHAVAKGRCRSPDSC
jgi:hypothetical protein